MKLELNADIESTCDVKLLLRALSLSLLMLSCSYHTHAMLTVVHIGDCENVRKIPFNSPCTRCCTCTHTHRCKHSSVLSLNDQSQGDAEGPESR